MKSRAVLRALIAAALLVMGLSVAGPASAVGCYGDYCSGQDPASTGCANDAYTATAVNFQYGSVQERYSPTCKTNWTRLVIYPTGNRCADYGSLWAVQDTGYRTEKDVPFVCGTRSTTTYWTPMIYSPVHRVRGEWYDKFQTLGASYTPWA